MTFRCISAWLVLNFFSFICWRVESFKTITPSAFLVLAMLITPGSKNYNRKESFYDFLSRGLGG
jgi:hypothetical protein